MSRAWDNLGLSEKTLRHLREDLKFEFATPTQATCIPLMLANKDVAVEACTGSGKTLSFVIPVVERLFKEAMAREASGEVNPSEPVIRALIISPTRELASQIHEVVTALVSSDNDLSNRFASVCYVGGREEGFETMSVGSRTRPSQQPCPPTVLNLIVVGTPGRIKHSVCRLPQRNCEYLVLDEADRLLDPSFESEIGSILSALPKQRRTYLFSATLTSGIHDLVKRAGMRNPAMVKVQRRSKDGSEDSEASNNHQLPSNLINEYVLLKQSEKMSYLYDFIKSHENTGMVVFFLTCASVEFHYSILSKLRDSNKGSVNPAPIYRLHGRMPPQLRIKTMEAFRRTPNAVLLCTDLVARGIDVAHVDWIVQFDAPQDPAFFVHRVGRTARAGRDGGALLMLTEEEGESYVEFLKGRGVDMVQRLPNLAAPCTLLSPNYIRENFTSLDRSILLQSSSAFVSYIRAYQAHLLHFIFSMQKLNIPEVALSFGCLRIPRVKEILGKKMVGFDNFHVKPDDVPFLQASRESKRLEELKKEKEKAGKELEDKKLQRTKAKEEELRKKKELHVRTRSEKREATREGKRAEWDDLAREERLAKKLKQGKISKKEYEKVLLGKDDEEGTSEGESTDGSSSEQEIDSDIEALDSLEKASKKRKGPLINQGPKHKNRRL